METVRAEQETVKSVSVLGINMEAAGIRHGDTVVYDTSKRPAQAGDVVVVKMTLMFNRETEEVRSYCGCYAGAHWIKTCYSGAAADSFRCIPEGDFIGVVAAIIAPGGIVKWEKDISGYPERLSREQTLNEEPGNHSFLAKHSELIKKEGQRMNASICTEMEELGFRLKGLSNMAALFSNAFDGVSSMDSYEDAFSLFASLMTEFNGEYDNMLGRLLGARGEGVQV